MNKRFASLFTAFALIAAMGCIAQPAYADETSSTTASVTQDAESIAEESIADELEEEGLVVDDIDIELEEFSLEATCTEGEADST
ncbi:hypothetical protein [Bifidobacterium sp.]|uniref:hypothetical protein n=1 Tax=Bifidobacterium sp. TaxID=41200 RepID=UPI0039EC22BF